MSISAPPVPRTPSSAPSTGEVRRAATPPPAVSSWRRNPVLRLLGSNWFGIGLLFVILVYASILSALAPARAALEMTEMEAFSHWFFVTLAVLFMLSLVAATLVRSRWMPVNTGALVTHIGLIMLTLGALYYFGTKVEGDLLLQLPGVYVQADIPQGKTVVGSMPTRAGAKWTAPALLDGTRVSVLATGSSGNLPVATATIAVQQPDGQPKPFTLLAGQDWQPVGGRLSAALIPRSSERYFYNRERPALFVRNTETKTELMRPLDHLPRYNPRFPADAGPLKDEAGNVVVSSRTQTAVRLLGLSVPTGWFERWHLPLDIDTGDLPFTLRVVGFLPYVVSMRQAPGPDGAVREEPVLALPQNRRTAVAAILVEVTGRDNSRPQRLWCPFSMYPDTDSHPVQFQVGGQGPVWEVVFSRLRHDLGAVLTGEILTVTHFPGHQGIDGYRSDFMIEQPGVTPYKAAVATNHTYKIGKWTLYQSGYDADQEWRYTVLGVGNRNGVWIMTIGSAIVALGCLYAFYVKPWLIRRMRLSAALS